METLAETDWDVVLAGTGLQQSLLALALSRSGKKILHVDQNDYYGGAEAALTLQEAEQWVQKVNQPIAGSQHQNAVLHITDQNLSQRDNRLGASRAYSLSLSPKLIFTRSNLLPTLVSSRVHEQLEFLAVGPWWIFEPHSSDRKLHGEDVAPDPNNGVGSLRKIPGSREDVVADRSVPLRAQRPLMNLLKLAADPEAHAVVAQQHSGTPFSAFMSTEHHIPKNLQPFLHALTLSPNPLNETSTAFALTNIHRHLTSTGLFGPGFGAVVSKWGGLSEVAQVGCRAGAVGGAVYVLNKGIKSVEEIKGMDVEENGQEQKTQRSLEVRLEGGEQVRTSWLIGTSSDLPTSDRQTSDAHHTSCAIFIVESPLADLFPPPREGAPPPAATVIVFPSGSLPVETSDETVDNPPVYVTVHSADTGECPNNQCIIYAQTKHSPFASSSLKLATNKLLESTHTPLNSILFTLTYDLTSPSLSAPQIPDHIRVSIASPSPTEQIPVRQNANFGPHVITLPSTGSAPGSTIALEDSVLHSVRAAWDRITAHDDPETKGSFMVFSERETGADDEDEDDDQGLRSEAAAEVNGGEIAGESAGAENLV